jgi:hypothetical protein
MAHTARAGRPSPGKFRRRKISRRQILCNCGDWANGRISAKTATLATQTSKIAQCGRAIWTPFDMKRTATRNRMVHGNDRAEGVLPIAALVCVFIGVATDGAWGPIRKAGQTAGVPAGQTRSTNPWPFTRPSIGVLPSGSNFGKLTSMVSRLGTTVSP